MELVPFIVVLGALFFVSFFAGRRRTKAPRGRGRSDSALDSSVYPPSDTSPSGHLGHHHHHDAGSHSHSHGHGHGHDGGFSHGGSDFGSGHGGSDFGSGHGGGDFGGGHH